MGSKPLSPSVAYWSMAVLCMVSLGAATLASLIFYDHESGWFVPLSLASVSLLAMTSAMLIFKRARPFFLTSGALTVLLALSFHSIEDIGLVGSWGVFFLCLYAILLGGKVLEIGRTIDLRSKEWIGGDPIVASSIWREGLRITALLGAAFLFAFLLLSIAGLLAVGDLPLLFLALMSVLILIVFHFIVSMGSRSER